MRTVVEVMEVVAAAVSKSRCRSTIATAATAKESAAAVSATASTAAVHAVSSVKGGTLPDASFDVVVSFGKRK